MNQEKLLAAVRVESGERARRALETANLSDEEMQNLRSAQQKLEQAAMIHHVRLRHRYRGKMVIDILLDIGRVLNMIEAAHFPGGIHDQDFRARIMNEFKIYGATREVQMILWQIQDWERPSYAVVDYRGGYDSVSSLNFFGPYRFVVRPAMRARSTFTPSDSFQVERDQVYVWENIDGVLAKKLNGRSWYNYVLSDTEPFITTEGVHYIEAQVIGGFELTDFSKLYYPAADRADRAFFTKLQRLELDHGIELVHY